MCGSGWARFLSAAFNAVDRRDIRSAIATWKGQLANVAIMVDKRPPHCIVGAAATTSIFADLPTPSELMHVTMPFFSVTSLCRGGTLVTAARRERASAVRPSSFAYRTISAACWRVILTSGLCSPSGLVRRRLRTRLSLGCHFGQRFDSHFPLPEGVAIGGQNRPIDFCLKQVKPMQFGRGGPPFVGG